MGNLRCAKPASVGAEPASKIERLGGAFDSQNSIFKGPSQADSRRLVGAHWSPALPQTAFAAALLRALARRAVEP
jgi:hypothetical protein